MRALLIRGFYYASLNVFLIAAIVFFIEAFNIKTGFEFYKNCILTGLCFNSWILTLKDRL